jgi:hypothetical protein
VKAEGHKEELVKWWREMTANTGVLFAVLNAT